MTPDQAMRAAITRVPSLVALDARDAVHAAAVTWRAAELAGVDVDSPRWVELLAALRDAVDAAMRLGADDDGPVGEIPPTLQAYWQRLMDVTESVRRRDV